MQASRTAPEFDTLDLILDVAVVGSGLSGVAIAHELCQRGLKVALFEARPRLGGRIESVACAEGTALDLGPTWYWPAAQPRMHALVERLGLRSLPQHDPGDLLVLEHAGDAPKLLQSEGLHAGARRLAAGMQSLLDALAQDLPRERVHLEHALCTVTKREALLELGFDGCGERRVVRARRAVLAMPPRLIAEQVRFEPELDEDLEASLHATPTWMGTAAKVVLRYPAAFWRAAGRSGNAFVQHLQAVLGEVFDSCDEAAGLFALGAFLALSPQERERYSAGLPLLMRHQIPQLFETGQAEPALHYRDWAREPWTCSRRDLREHVPHAAHPECGAPELARPYWSERLFFAGSETAEREGGYLEGALVAAERVLLQLSAAESSAAEAMEDLRSWLQAQHVPTLARYQQAIFAGLAGQVDEPLTQRALLSALAPVFEGALRALQAQRAPAPVALQALAREAFRDFLPELLRAVLTWNRRSCALSNFDEEHRPSHSYLQAILHELDAAFARFSREVEVLAQRAASAAHPENRSA